MAAAGCSPNGRATHSGAFRRASMDDTLSRARMSGTLLRPLPLTLLPPPKLKLPASGTSQLFSGGGERHKQSPCSCHAGGASNTPTGCHLWEGPPHTKGKRTESSVVVSTVWELLTVPPTGQGVRKMRCTGNSRQPVACGNLWCIMNSAARGVAALMRSGGRRVRPRMERST